MTLAGKAGMMPIPLLDDRYPALLSVTVDPPPVLWVQGQAELLSRPTVAVVGSRAATPYALEVAARLGEELAQRGIVVASGLARGVDSAAHRGLPGWHRAARPQFSDRGWIASIRPSIEN